MVNQGMPTDGQANGNTDRQEERLPVALPGTGDAVTMSDSVGDITTRSNPTTQEMLDYVESILATVREPLLVLDRDLRVVTANRSFYRVFHVAAGETENRRVYELGNGQWDIPELRRHLEDVLPQNHHFDDFEV